MAYVMGLFFVAGILLVTGMPVALLIGGVAGGNIAGATGIFVAAVGVVIVIGYLMLNVRWAIRRLHDFDVNGWFTIILILPLIGLFLWRIPRMPADSLGATVFALSGIILILPLLSVPLWLMPGTRGGNNYGPTQPPNTPGVILSALSAPLAFMLLAGITISAYRDSQIRLKMQAGHNLSNPARTALGIACQEGDIARKTDNDLLGLARPTAYGDKVVKSVAVAGLSDTSAQVTITFRAIGDAVPEGAQIVYRGTCSSRGMTWTVTTGAGMPAKFKFSG